MPYAANEQISTEELPGGIEISDEQYAAALWGILAGKVVSIDNGFAIIDPPAPSPEPEPEPLTLDQVKAGLKASIDSAAEIERMKYITPGSGQAMTYMQKADEASRYLAASDPVAADYPLLSAEVGVTAPTVGEVAAIVNAAFTQWQQIGAAIEAARLGTKVAIEAATAAEEAQAAADAVAWPSP